MLHSYVKCCNISRCSQNDSVMASFFGLSRSVFVVCSKGLRFKKHFRRNSYRWHLFQCVFPVISILDNSKFTIVCLSKSVADHTFRAKWNSSLFWACVTLRDGSAVLASTFHMSKPTESKIWKTIRKLLPITRNPLDPVSSAQFPIVVSVNLRWSEHSTC